MGRYDLDVTTFQMAVMFAWNQRTHDKISFDNLRLATELPDPELRRTLWVCLFTPPSCDFIQNCMTHLYELQRF